MKSIRILSAARHDLVRGYHFYERQAPGVGRYFLDSLSSDIESLGLNAGMHPVAFGNYQRQLSQRFPWAIYYRVEDDLVLIYAILDNRADPRSTQQRLTRNQD